MKRQVSLMALIAGMLDVPALHMPLGPEHFFQARGRKPNPGRNKIERCPFKLAGRA